MCTADRSPTIWFAGATQSAAPRTAEGKKIVEPAVYGTDGQCNQPYPPHSAPRLEAGAPLADDIWKCQLKPIDFKDYGVEGFFPAALDPIHDLMATCPRCFGPLTEDHRCPRGRFGRVGDALMTVLAGALVGGVLPVVFSDGAPLALVVAAAALGGVLANAVRQAMNPHP